LVESGLTQVWEEVAYYRRPCSRAHELLASMDATDAAFFLAQGREEDAMVAFEAAVGHYSAAAEAGLPDTRDGAILWWGAAANMARVGPPYTVGGLREAITNAEACGMARDIEMWGEDKTANGSYAQQARVLAEWCQGLDAEEALPRLDVVFGDSATELKATVGGKACVCADFDEYMRCDAARREELEEKNARHAADQEVYARYGLEVGQGILPLRVLAVRALHAMDHPCARGLSDAALIASNAAVSAEE